MGDSSLLNKKLDEYINKYYLNQVIRGCLITVSVVIGYLLLVSGIEYLGNFGSGTRAVLFYSFLLGSLGLVVWMVLMPLSKMAGWTERMSLLDAAELINGQFGTVDDKLVDTLQLAAESRDDGADQTLLLASLDQRIAELRPIPFASAIDLGKNKRFLKYAIPPIAIALIAVFLFPALFTDGTGRLIAHSKEFKPAAPFAFELLNGDLRAIQNEDLPIEVRVVGESIPAELMLELNGNRHRMSAESGGVFSFTARQLQESSSFRFYGGGFYSDVYAPKVVPKPLVSRFSVELDFPNYLRRQTEAIENAGDLTIPEGTVIGWQFDARNSEALNVAILDSTYNSTRVSETLFSLNYRARKSSDYQVVTSNDKVGLATRVTRLRLFQTDIRPSM